MAKGQKEKDEPKPSQNFDYRLTILPHTNADTRSQVR